MPYLCSYLCPVREQKWTNYWTAVFCLRNSEVIETDKCKTLTHTQKKNPTKNLATGFPETHYFLRPQRGQVEILYLKMKNTFFISQYCIYILYLHISANHRFPFGGKQCYTKHCGLRNTIITILCIKN